jgi:DNA ligase-1
MTFLHVADVFNKLDQTQSRSVMTQLLADLLKQASPTEASIICNLSLGQLHPPYISTQFTVATATMTKVVAQLLGESEAFVKQEAQKLGDLGTVVELHAQHKPQQELTIDDVYQALTKLEAMGGAGSQEEKTNFLYTLLQQLDPLAAKYVVRMVLGKLRLGFSDMTLMDALSWMEAGDKSLRRTIEDAYNICADIGLIARTLKEQGASALQHMHIQLGIPIRPSAAERLPTARAVVEKLGPCIAQPKLDGFRLQIHLDKRDATPVVHFFSRNLLDMSYMFPDLVEAMIQLEVTTLICEGEAIVYDPITNSFLPFQETVKRKRKHGIEEAIAEYPLRFYVFDLLYMNGKEYLTSTHEERRNALLALFKGFDTETVQVIEEKKITTAQELEQYFVANIAAGLEGLVVKRPDAVYQPGKRNFNWIKLKRQEEGHVEDTIDCVILGYYAGEGKRASFGIGAFLVGVFNKQEDRFETIAKIGTGLKDADWVELKTKCDALRVATQPKNVICAKDLYPDVWVTPEIVVIIRADEITMSPVHAAGKTADILGYALRFPRFMGYALDKSFEEATTVDEIKHLYKDQFVR